MIVTKEYGTKMTDTTITKFNPVFIDAKKAPFTFFGFDSPFVRVPHDVAERTSEGVLRMADMSAGGRIRFITNSEYVCVHFTVSSKVKNESFNNTSLCDLHVYEGGKFRTCGAFFPSQGTDKNYCESRIMLRKGYKDLILNLPVCGIFDSFYIAVSEGSELLPGGKYLHETPVVCYGSSIVHGYGSSKASACYPSIISRRLNTDIRDLGFGGNAKGETAILEYIAGLKMSVFIYDYDHNAPDPEYLEKTHYAGYKLFRKAQPDTPVILASKPDYYNWNASVEENEKRRLIIQDTYNRAVAEGDKNIYFIDGRTFYPEEFRDEYTADGCHPNDAGYIAMAMKFCAILENLI